MLLRRKILLALLVTLAMLVAGIYALANVTVMKGFNELESESLQVDVQRVREALIRDIVGLVEKSGDWGFWDDMYAYIQKPDPKFVQSNVSISTAMSLRIDALIITDLEGKPLVAREFDRHAGTDAPIKSNALLETMLPGHVLNPTPGTELKALDNSDDSAAFEDDRLITLDPPGCSMPLCAGIIRVDGQLYLVASRPALPSAMSGTPVGRVAFLRRFDQAELDELGARTHITVFATPVAASMAAGISKASGSGAGGEAERVRRLRESPHGTVIATPVDANVMVGETLFHDLTGRPLMVLRIEVFRHIVARGTQSLMFFTLSMLVCGIAFGFVTYILLDRLVLSRLLALGEDIQHIGRTVEFNRRVRKDGNDELTSLADAINQALEDIERSHSLLHEREAESRKLALVAARTDNMVIITDPKGKVEWVNEGFIRRTGFTLAEVIGKVPGHLLVGPDTDPATTALMREQIQKGRGFHVQILNYDKSRRSYWVDIEVQPIFDSTGRLQNFMAIESDVTESRRLTEALRQARDAAQTANQAKSQFLANMSHEIRTPMTAILGFAELLNDASTSPSQRNNYANSIVRNGQHLLAIINDILDISKIEADKMTTERVPTPVGQVLAEALSNSQQRADEKKLALEVIYRTPIPATIISDPFRLRQILSNLVSNAVKFTERGSVTVNVLFDAPSAAESRIRFDVVDTGVGISESEREGLFRPFTQADTSTTRRFGGTGLGLTISRRLAELLGGDLTLSSEPGKGSTFTLRLPTGPLKDVKMETKPITVAALAEKNPLQVLEAKADSGVVDKTKPLADISVLLAEDGIDNQQLISYLLTRAGAHVSIVGTGTAAVKFVLDAIAQGNPPDVVLMDMQMPEMDGYGATRLLREHHVTTRIVALTAHAMATDREKCLQAGCDDFVSKPISRDVLLNAVLRNVNGRAG
jgi:PAS domain S-box-containing protein